MTEAFEGLNEIEWSRLNAAYGPADDVPRLLSAGARGDRDAWFDLWGSVVHQGTLYEATAFVAPHLVRVALSESVDRDSRAEACFLLAGIASAMSFVLPQDPLTMHCAAWCREPGLAAPGRELDVECFEAVSAHAESLAMEIGSVERRLQAGILAVLGAVGSTLTDKALSAIAPLVAGADDLLAAAARVTVSLASGERLQETIAEASSLDADAAAYQQVIAEWPERVRATALTSALCERAASEG